METKRLIIRKAEESDLQAYLNIRNSEFVLQYNPMSVITMEKGLERLKEYNQSENVFFLETKDDNKLIGAVFAEQDDLRYRVESKTISYFLDEKCSGKGLMSEALKEIVKHLFRDEKTEVISARAFSENIASLKLLEKIGFTREGILRHCVKGLDGKVYDDVVFSLLKSEF